jgi:hypothetical protein
MTDSRLIQAVQELDSGTRALLDLSLRRAIPDERVAGLLGVELAEIPRRRARGIAELADKLAIPGPAELASLLVALPELPDEAWGVPNPKLPKVKKVSAARRAKAFRRAAVAASPLVAAGAVLAAVIVSSGGGGQKSANLTLQGRLASGGKHQPAAVAKAPAKADARHALPRGAQVASAEEPSLATLTARKAAARHRRQRARHRGQAPAVNTIPVSDNFATSAPQPDAYVPPPKPKQRHKPHVQKPKPTQPEAPTTTTPVQVPATPAPEVVASPPTEQVTTTTPQVIAPKQESPKKPPVPAVPNVVQPPPQQSSGDDDGNDDNGGGCDHGGGDHRWGGGDDHKSQSNSSVFKTRREQSHQRSGWPHD